MLKDGSSKPWPDAMKELTNSTNMSTAALQEYFKPLITWLKAQNDANGDVRGWEDDTWKPSNV